MPDDNPTATEMLNAWLREHSIGDGLPGRAILFNNLLYPQYADDFKTVPEDIWLAIQRRAARLLADGGGAHEMHQHWRDIIDGIVPFGMRVIKADGTEHQPHPLR